MTELGIWEELGIQPTNDMAAIRHAFAQRVTQCHPEEDPKGFQRLNEAYRTASGFSRRLNAPIPGERPPMAVPEGAIREWTPPPVDAPARPEPAEEDAPLDFAALIAKGVLSELQPPPKHLTRIQKFLTQMSPARKTWSERNF